MKTLATASIAALFAAAVPSMAATVDLDSFTNTTPPADTRLNGSATASATTIDGVNSTVLMTSTSGVDSQEKVAPFFYAGTLGSPIGTLGDLGRGGLTADWLLNSRGANTPSFVGNIAAFRLRVDGPTAGTFAEIIWETGYQSPVPTFVEDTNYNDIDIGSGKFYARYLGQNYGDGNNGAVNPLTLSQLAAGGQLTGTSPVFTDATNIYGLQVSIGSAADDYSANVGDINATFTAVPEPAALAAIVGGAALLLGRRRRRAV